MSEIAEFYKDQTIFLTGATGTVGKLLIEKLLRVSDVKTIYVLLRAKKNVNAEDRLQSLLSGSCFDNLRSLKPNFREKIGLVKGDCEQVDLGLSGEDQTLLSREVTIFLHAAANVKFEQSLRSAAYNNVRAVRDCIVLAKTMTKLGLFIYVSTAFSNCPRGYIEERFYEAPMKAEDLLHLVDILDDEVLAKATPSVLGKWPNTYVFSKAVAEDLVRREAKDLNAAIVRPAIITVSVKEPSPGYVDNLYGMGGLLVAIGLGVVRVLYASEQQVIWGVPCDFVVNNILAVGWNTSRERDNGEMKIYNNVGMKTDPVTIGVIRKQMWVIRRTFPLDNTVWFPDTIFTMNKFFYKFCTFWFYIVIPHIVDAVAICFGKKLDAAKKAKRLNDLLLQLFYFVVNKFEFETDNGDELRKKMNEEDRKLFDFDGDKVDIATLMMNGSLGSRRNILKQTDDGLPKARKRMAILEVLHYVTIIIFWYLIYRLVMWGARCIFA